MEAFNLMQDEEELDPITGQPVMPNTARDPDDPREKLKAYLAQKMASDKQMASPEYRQSQRAPQNALMDSNRELALSKLLMNSANQAGTIGGKAASSQGFDQYAGELQGQNQQLMQGMDRERAGAEQADQGRMRIMQYLADKMDKKEHAGIQDKRYAEGMDLKKRSVAAQEKAAGMREQERTDKKADDLAELAVPGYERTGEVMQSKPEAKDARDTVGTANNIMKGIELLKQQMAESGNFEWGGAKGAEMAATANDLRLQAKELYKLGVLNGPDLGLLLKQIPDTESLGALFTREDTAKASLDSTATSMKRKIEEGMRSKGYEPKPEKPGTPSAAAKGPADYDSMSDEELAALYKQRGGK